MSTLRNFFRFLDRTGRIHNPAVKSVKTPRLPKSVPKALDEADAIAAIRNVGELQEEPWVAARDQALMLLLYGCGLRLGEALSLTWETRTNADILRITGKGQKERIVPVLTIGERRHRKLSRTMPIQEFRRYAAVPGPARKAPQPAHYSAPNADLARAARPARTRDPPCLAPQFRDASACEGWGLANHPGTARPTRRCRRRSGIRPSMRVI